MDETSTAGYIELPLDAAESASGFRPVGQETRAGADPKGLAPWFGRTLRIALAMKGGLSLAVWIGGAIAELDVLRRIRIYRAPDERVRALIFHVGSAEDVRGDSAHLVKRATQYARLLASRGYDRVEFDVLAGASAGGLNAVLYATAQRAGVGFDTILQTWVDTGSAWGLLQTGSPTRYDSIMRGDTYFWPEVAKALDQIARRQPSCPEMRAEHVVVDLSATLIDAVDSSDRATSEGRAQFRFVGEDARPGSLSQNRRPVPDRDIPMYRGEESIADYERDIARIAYAARTTSSFPSIFEPALIYSGAHPLDTEHGWRRGDDRATERAIDAPDMRMVFNAHRGDAATHPFRVVDGGLLDNIPIDRALNAVRNMPAQQHINRAIIYLDPSPKEVAALFRRPTAYEAARPALHRRGERFDAETATTREDVGSRLAGTIISSLRKRGARESRDDEIEDVDLVRAAVTVARARNELLAVRMDGAAPRGERQETEARRAYALYRATSDLELLTPALLHPGEWLLGTELLLRPELAALDRVGMVHVESAFRSAADALQDPALGRDGPAMDADEHAARVARGAQALVDTCMTALSWIRAIENTAFQEGALDRLDLRLREREASSRAGLRSTMNRVTDTARWLRDSAILATLVDAQVHLDLGSMSAERAVELVAQWHRHDTRNRHARDSEWRVLDGVVRELFVFSSAIDEIADCHARWQRTPWSRLDASPEFRAEHLPLVFGGSGIPQPISSVRFHRIGSDVQPAHAAEYRLLMEDQLLRGYRSALGRRTDELDGVTVGNYLEETALRSNAKLAGLRTANLAGFLSGSWRTNDWWWGRLDAAAGMVEFLESMIEAPAKRGVPDGQTITVPDADAALDEVQAELLRQLSRTPPFDATDVPPTEPASIRERFIRGTQGLDSLGEHYRVAIASRTLRAASTAMTNGDRRITPNRLAHLVARPLLALLPASVSAPRTILLVSFLACAALLMWPVSLWNPPLRPLDDDEVIASLVFTIVIALLPFLRLVGSSRSHRRRRRKILEHTTTRPWARSVMERAERRARAGRIWLTAVTIVLAGLLIVVDRFYGMGSVLFWACLVALIAATEATARALRTVPTSLAPRSPATPSAVIGGVSAIGITAILTSLLLERPSAEGAMIAAWHGAGAAAIAILVTLTLLAGCYTSRFRVLAPVGAVALAASASVALVNFLASAYDPLASQLAEIAIGGWVAGTVLWWVAWWRGWSTEPDHGPTDEVPDHRWTPKPPGSP